MFELVLDGWIEGWIVTVDTLPVRGLDPGAPPANWRGPHATQMCMPNPTRIQCKQGPMGCNKYSMYKPHVFINQQGRGKQCAAGHHNVPRGGTTRWNTKIRRFFIRKFQQLSELLLVEIGVNSVTSINSEALNTHRHYFKYYCIRIHQQQ